MKKILLIILCLLLVLGTACSAEFSDVKQGDWYYDNVMQMSEKGYLKGYEDGGFRPGNSITAAEYVAVVARVCGLGEGISQNSHWAGGLLQAALDKGWYDWDEIPPTAGNYDEPITRQIAVKIIMRAFAPDARGDYNMESAKIADFSQLDGRYYDGVLAAYSKGIVTGDDNGNFNPKASLTRAEACALISRAVANTAYKAEDYKETVITESTAVPVVASKDGVSVNGALQVIGTQLCNTNGEPIVLRGMSSHGIQWFGKFLSREAIKSTADAGANLFRIAMYTSENGYISNTMLKQQVINAVDTVIALDMYVIIDWHILSDGNPNTYREQSRAFFAEMAQRYKGNPAVIYEICNEPNGNVMWSGDVKPYAEDIIGTIRAVDDKAIILVGSPTWSQDLHEVAKDPLKAQNIMYTCHFYAGTHTQWLRDRIVSSKLPVFVSEWGLSDASGSGGVYFEEGQRWIEFMDKNNISWANWSLCDKQESSAAVVSGADISDGISYDELTESGKFVFGCF